jgi:hypothetical protein
MISVDACSVPASPSSPRSTGQRDVAHAGDQEGSAPLKNWIKSALDRVIQECMNEPALEFVWVGDDAVDPLQQAQTLEVLVGAGIKTREEARAELGLGPVGAKGLAGGGPAALGKYNHDHDEQGLFSTAGGAVDEGGRRQPKGIQAVSTDS